MISLKSALFEIYATTNEDTKPELVNDSEVIELIERLESAVIPFFKRGE